MEDTNVIQVTAEANSREQAAAGANALLADYIQEDVDRNLTDIQTALDFAQGRQAVTEADLNLADDQYRDFLNKHHIAELDSQRADEITRIGALTTSYQTTQYGLAGAKDQLKADEALLAQQPHGLYQSAKATNPEIAIIIAKIDDLKSQREALLQPGQFTAKAPEVQFVDAQIKTLQLRLNALPSLVPADSIAPNPAIENLTGAVQTQRAAVSSFEGQLATIEQDLSASRAHLGMYSGWAVQLNRLLREHDQALGQYKMFQSKIADLALRKKANRPPATIIEYGRSSSAPIRPRRLLNMVLGLLLGLLVGAGLAVTQEVLDDRIVDVEDGNRVLRLPSLGFIPILSGDDVKVLKLLKWFSPSTESYRVLRTNIQFASIDRPAHSLLVASANQNEGKSTTALNLTYAMALDGKRVILIDTDLRRPSVHRMLSMPLMPGITDVLLGNDSLTDALRPLEHHPMVSVLTAGSLPPNPAELVNSEAFRRLVDQLKLMADVIVFDSPPLLAAADGAILSSIMDGTVLVVEAGKTKKAAASRAHNILQLARARILGVVYNRMSGSSDGSYYYYNYKYTSELAPSITGATPGSPLTKLSGRAAETDKVGEANEV
jgi:capsular exopolysaccharide synthesis family protein